MINIICNQCGESIRRNESYQSLDFKFGYGSEYDGKLIHIDIHDSCMDKALYNLMRDFVIKPELEDYLSSSCSEGVCGCDYEDSNVDDVYGAYYGHE